MLNAAVLLGAVTIAIVATLETLLNLEAVDKLDHQQRVSRPIGGRSIQGTLFLVFWGDFRSHR